MSKEAVVHKLYVFLYEKRITVDLKEVFQLDNFSSSKFEESLKFIKKFPSLFKLNEHDATAKKPSLQMVGAYFQLASNTLPPIGDLSKFKKISFSKFSVLTNSAANHLYLRNLMGMISGSHKHVYFTYSLQQYQGSVRIHLEDISRGQFLDLFRGCKVSADMTFSVQGTEQPFIEVTCVKESVSSGPFNMWKKNEVAEKSEDNPTPPGDVRAGQSNQTPAKPFSWFKYQREENTEIFLSDDESDAHSDANEKGACQGAQLMPSISPNNANNISKIVASLQSTSAPVSDKQSFANLIAFNLVLWLLKTDTTNTGVLSKDIRTFIVNNIKPESGMIQSMTYPRMDEILGAYPFLFWNMGANSSIGSKFGRVRLQTRDVLVKGMIKMSENVESCALPDNMISPSLVKCIVAAEKSVILFNNLTGYVTKTAKNNHYYALLPNLAGQSFRILFSADTNLNTTVKHQFSVRIAVNSKQEVIATVMSVNDGKTREGKKHVCIMTQIKKCKEEIAAKEKKDLENSAKNVRTNEDISAKSSQEVISIKENEKTPEEGRVAKLIQEEIKPTCNEVTKVLYEERVATSDVENSKDLLEEKGATFHVSQAEEVESNIEIGNDTKNTKLEGAIVKHAETEGKESECTTNHHISEAGPSSEIEQVINVSETESFHQKAESNVEVGSGSESQVLICDEETVGKQLSNSNCTSEIECSVGTTFKELSAKNQADHKIVNTASKGKCQAKFSSHTTEIRDIDTEYSKSKNSLKDFDNPKKLDSILTDIVHSNSRIAGSVNTFSEILPFKSCNSVLSPLQEHAAVLKLMTTNDSLTSNQAIKKIPKNLISEVEDKFEKMKAETLAEVRLELDRYRNDLKNVEENCEASKSKLEDIPSGTTVSKMKSEIISEIGVTIDEKYKAQIKSIVHEEILQLRKSILSELKQTVIDKTCDDFRKEVMNDVKFELDIIKDKCNGLLQDVEAIKQTSRVKDANCTEESVHSLGERNKEEYSQIGSNQNLQVLKAGLKEEIVADLVKTGGHPGMTDLFKLGNPRTSLGGLLKVKSDMCMSISNWATGNEHIDGDTKEVELTVRGRVRMGKGEKLVALNDMCGAGVFFTND